MAAQGGLGHLHRARHGRLDLDGGGPPAQQRLLLPAALAAVAPSRGQQPHLPSALVELAQATVDRLPLVALRRGQPGPEDRVVEHGEEEDESHPGEDAGQVGRRRAGAPPDAELQGGGERHERQPHREREERDRHRGREVDEREERPLPPPGRGELGQRGGGDHEDRPDLQLLAHAGGPSLGRAPHGADHRDRRRAAEEERGRPTPRARSRAGRSRPRATPAAARAATPPGRVRDRARPMRRRTGGPRRPSSRYQASASQLETACPSTAWRLLLDGAGRGRGGSRAHRVAPAGGSW